MWLISFILIEHYLLALHTLDMNDKLLTEDLNDFSGLLSLEVTTDDHDLIILTDWE